MTIYDDRAGLICHNCADFIQSAHGHDYRPCKCGAVAIDGGSLFLRITGDLGTFTVVPKEDIGSKWMHDEVVHWEREAV